MTDIEYITEENYIKLQNLISEEKICKVVIPIGRIYYLLYIFDESIKVFMPYKGNEWIIASGDKPRTVRKAYFDRDTFNKALSSLPQCPYHFFGTHDICSDSIITCNDEEICAICTVSDKLTRLISLPCGHLFHMVCLNRYALQLKQESLVNDVDVKCPTCRYIVNRLDVRYPRDDDDD